MPYSSVTATITGSSIFANQQLLGLYELDGGDNIVLDSSGTIATTQDPSFTTLTVGGDASFNGVTQFFGDVSATDISCVNVDVAGVITGSDIQANTATFESDVVMNTDLDVIGDLSANTATFGGTINASGLNIIPQTVCTFGKTSINNSHHGNAAVFSHTDLSAQTEYGVLHNSVGGLVLNSATGQPIQFMNNNLERVRISNNGLVGIGTTNPQAPLHVTGYNSGTITSSGGYVFQYNDTHPITGGGANIGLYVPSNIVTNSVFVGYNITFSSDSRIKTNIQDINDGEALTKLRGLRPKTYDYIDKTKGTSTVIGFIAQEILEDLPEAHELTHNSVPNFYQPGTLTNMVYDNNNNLVSATVSYDTDVVLEYDPDGNLITTLDIRTMLVNTTDNRVTIVSIDEVNRTIDITGHIADIPDTNIVWLYGQRVTDFNTIKKDYIYTITTSALQEVDRQQTADKLRISELETQITNILARLSAGGL